MPSMENTLQQVNLRLILLLDRREEREGWQRDTLDSILPGTIQSQSRFAEDMGYYLDVSWIEYGPAAGSWKEAKNLLTDAAFEQEPDLLQAAGRARGLIQEAGRSHEPRPALIVVRAAEKEEAGSLPDELNGQGSIRAVISMLAEADADALNAENMETGLRMETQTEEGKEPGLFWTVHSADQLMTALSQAIPGCLSASRRLYESNRAAETTAAAETGEDQPEQASVDMMKAEKTDAEEMKPETAPGHADDGTDAPGSGETADNGTASPAAEQAEGEESGAEKDPAGGDAGAHSENVQEPAKTADGAQGYVVPQIVSRREQDEHYVERAQHREEYCTYDAHSYVQKDADAFRIFEARRIGLGHLGKKMPCQDACLYAEHAHGFVIMAADGVSACPRSDVGSKIACESVAQLVAECAEAEENEEKFVQSLCSDAFFRKIRAEWLRRITEDVKQNPAEGSSVSVPRLYGTTLMFAAATEHWWVCRNIGDGQIVLFNEQDFQRIRLTEKDSPAPRGLMYDTYLEHVQTGVFARDLFSGILLTTDGMADQMSKIGPNSWHVWALQLQKRFAETDEPYLPFVYEGIIAGEERRPDLSRQRNASDDCTVVLAFAEGQSVPAWMQKVRQSILSHVEEGAEIELHRTLGRRISYTVYTKHEKRLICAVPENEACAVRSPRLGLGQIVLLPQTRDDVWSEAGYRFYAYSLGDDPSICTLEEAMQSFGYCSHPQAVRGVSLRTGEKVLKVDTGVNQAVRVLHEELTELQTHLDAAGLALDWTAACWMFMDMVRGRMLIPQAVLCEAPPTPSVPWHLTLDHLSPALIGFVTGFHQPWAYPFFSPGDAAEGSCYYLTGKSMLDLPEEKRRFFTVVRHPQNGMLGLRNAGSIPWKVRDRDGTEADCAPRGVAMLRDGRQIIVQVSASEIQTYTLQLTGGKGGDRA